MKYIRKYWPVIIIIGAWGYFSSPYFLHNLVPFPSRYLVDFFQPWSYIYAHPIKNNAMPDVITQIYPWKQAVVDSWKIGQVPRWNPYQFGGNPLLANVQSAAFSPFNLLFFIVPFIDAWSFMILSQPLTAGLGMYIFVRSLRVSKSGATISAISYMFCGFIVVWMAYGTLAFAVSYLPFLLYGIERWYQKADKLAIISIVLSITLSLFSGHFQMSIYVIIAGMFYAIWNGWNKKKQFGILSIWMVVGIVLALPQLLPSFAFYEQSLRSSLFGKGGESIPIRYIVTFLAPDFFGNPVTRNDWFGHYAEWMGFAGIMPLMLASAAILSWQRLRKAWFFIVLGFVALLMAYSAVINTFVISLHIPVLSTSAASRIIVLTSFSIAVLAGFGVDSMLRIKSLKIFRVMFLWIALLSFVWITILVGNVFFMTDATADQLTIARRNFLLPSAFVLFGLVLFTFMRFSTLFHAYGIFGRLIKSSSSFIFLTAILLITLFDSTRFATKWMPFDEKDFVYPSMEILTYLKEYSGYHRVFSNFDNPAFGTAKLYGLEGYDPLYIDRYGELVSALSDGQIGIPERSVVQIPVKGKNTQSFFDLVGVKYIAHAKADALQGWAYPFWDYPEQYDVAVHSDDNYEVYENKYVFPRAYLVHSYEVIQDDQQLIDRLFDSTVNLKQLVLLEKIPSIKSSVCAPFDDKAVTIVQYTPNKIVLTISAPCEGFVFLSDSYYAGWDVYVNDQHSELYRANYAFRAVAVPKGNSTVKFLYENWNR